MYSEHFSALFQTIWKSDTKCTDEAYTNVVDFSASQRAGFEMAFVKYMEFVEGWSYAYQEALAELDADSEEFAPTLAAAQGRVRDQWRLRANTCIKGCALHWAKSVRKVKSCAAMVPLEDCEPFQSLADELVTCSAASFEAQCLQTSRRLKRG